MIGSRTFRPTLVLAVAALTLVAVTSLTAQEVLTNDSLIALKKAGLSDSIIISKIKSSQTKFDASTKGLIGLKIAGKSDELVAANAALEFNTGFFDSKSELVLKGRKAPYRVADKKPVFYSTWSPNDVPLVRLKPGSDHDDRNLKISSGSFAPFGGSVKYGVRSEDKVDMEAAERDARGLYKLTPKEPLKPGEY